MKIVVLLLCLSAPLLAQPAARICDVQGRAHASSLAGQSVTLTGIVTSVARDSATGHALITLQSAPSDEDSSPLTSEALFVRLDDGPRPAPGDLLRVAGRLKEYNPGGVDSNLRFTTLMASSPAELLGRRALPRPVLLGAQGRAVPAGSIDDDTRGSIGSRPGPFDPGSDAIDFFESLEGMRVALPDALAVDATSKYGELVLLPDAGAASESLAGVALVIAEGDFNPERVMVQGGRWLDGDFPVPQVDAGARFDGPFVGVMSYSYGNPKIMLTQPAPAVLAPDADVAADTRVGLGPVPVGHARMVGYNVENLSPASDPARMARLGRHIAQDLGGPDLVALQEVQDGSGPDDDGSTSAAATLDALIAAIDAAGGPGYRAFELAPRDGADGGQPGGNIRVAFLVRNDGALAAVQRPGGGSDVAVEVQAGSDGAPRLSHSPGRVAPDHGAWHRSRVPLALELSMGGEPLFVVSCHLRSKGGDTPLFGMTQPFERPSERLRLLQTEVLSSFVDELLALDPNARVVLLGDFNDFQFSAPLGRLVQDGALRNLTDSLPAGERWTYIYQGNAQALDHMLVSPGFTAAAGGPEHLDYGVMHLNSVAHDGASDHDPCVLTFRVEGAEGDR